MAKKVNRDGEVVDDNSFNSVIAQAMASGAAGNAAENANDLARVKYNADSSKEASKYTADSSLTGTRENIAGQTNITSMNIAADAPLKKAQAGYANANANLTNANTTGVNLSNTLKKDTLPALTNQIKAGALFQTTEAQQGTADNVRKSLAAGLDVGGDQQIGTSPGDFIADQERRKLRDPRLATVPTYQRTSDPTGRMKVHSAPGKL